MATESVSTPVTDQSLAYIKRLEERVSWLESQFKRSESSEDEDEPFGPPDRYRRVAPSRRETHPPFPPLVPEVQIFANTIAFKHHVLPSDSHPAIEAIIYPTNEKDVEAQEAEFSKALTKVSRDKALEMIRAERAQPSLDWEKRGLALMRINSLPLVELLLNVYGINNDDPAVPINIALPFEGPIFYHANVKERLAEMEVRKGSSEEGQSDETSLIEELRCYVRLMDDIITRYSSFSSMTASDNFKVLFRDLWHVFKPGVTIFYPEATAQPGAADYAKLARSKNPTQKLWRVYSRSFNDDGDILIKAYYIDYDGDAYICVKEWFGISKYQGSVSITSLKVYPLRFASNGQKLMHESTENGRFLHSLITSKSRLFTHNGWAWEPDEVNPTLRHISGDVILDFGEVAKARPDWKPTPGLPQTSYRGPDPSPKPCKDRCLLWHWADTGGLHEFGEAHATLADDQIHRIEKIEYCQNNDSFLYAALNNQLGRYQIGEDNYHLLPCRLFAYSLSDRRFVAVDIANVSVDHDHGQGRNKFQNLVIIEDYERMLRALVKSHFDSKEIQVATGFGLTNQDIIHNKGKGLVILLHGVPGVGKTSTAETIAAEFNRPLLPITCGDLGLEPADVEDSLKEMFRLAQVWDCILLIDEADVFLAERVPSDLKRNALVSVFLRVLDYYSGVLFLTTNRVGIIDEAFKSRIHVSLYYPHLNELQSKRIWEINITRLKQMEAEQSALTNQPPLKIDEDRILKFAENHHRKSPQGRNGRRPWNGRQIRNAFLIAAALARFERQTRKLPSSTAYDLTDAQFEVVGKTGFGFERYLFEVKGQKTDTELAMLNGIRDDTIQNPDGKPRRSHHHHSDSRPQQRPPPTPNMRMGSRRSMSPDNGGSYPYTPPRSDDSRFEYPSHTTSEYMYSDQAEASYGQYSPQHHSQQSAMQARHASDQYGRNAYSGSGQGLRFKEDRMSGQYGNWYGSDRD